MFIGCCEGGERSKTRLFSGWAESSIGGRSVGFSPRGHRACGLKPTLLFELKLRHDRIVVADVALVGRNLPEEVHVVLVLLLAADDEVLADADRLEDQVALARRVGQERRRDQDVIELLVDEVRLLRLASCECANRSARSSSVAGVFRPRSVPMSPSLVVVSYVSSVFTSPITITFSPAFDRCASIQRRISLPCFLRISAASGWARKWTLSSAAARASAPLPHSNSQKMCLLTL